MTDRPKIVVLDDDPTGSQTVHSCLLLLQWDVKSLEQGLRDESPIFFILTNTRSRPPAEAERVTREVCRNLKQAIANLQRTQPQFSLPLIISRSDSTLRGHYPLETDAIAQELGPFDAHFLVPAFLEGGRITVDSTHYIVTPEIVTPEQADPGKRTPVHQTEFARDPVFAFHHSDLPSYVAEKTQGTIPAEQVKKLTLAELRAAGESRQSLRSRLQRFHSNTCVAVDAEQQSDLDQFAAAIFDSATQGKRFLFRSAASLLTSLANLPPQPVAMAEMHQYASSSSPGMILVGSYVQKSTQQLTELLKLDGIAGIEVDVAVLQQQPKGAEDLRRSLSAQIQHYCENGITPVVYTSRQPLRFDTTEAQLAFGQTVSSFLVALVQHLPPSLSFLISKGGVTSNDTLSRGLCLKQVRLLGQIIPGVCIVKTESNHPHFPDLPVVLFPGNVGEADSLAIAYRRLRPLP